MDVEELTMLIVLGVGLIALIITVAILGFRDWIKGIVLEALNEFWAGRKDGV